MESSLPGQKRFTRLCGCGARCGTVRPRSKSPGTGWGCGQASRMVWGRLPVTGPKAGLCPQFCLRKTLGQPIQKAGSARDTGSPMQAGRCIFAQHRLRRRGRQVDLRQLGSVLHQTPQGKLRPRQDHTPYQLLFCIDGPSWRSQYPLKWRPAAPTLLPVRLPLRTAALLPAGRGCPRRSFQAAF